MRTFLINSYPAERARRDGKTASATKDVCFNFLARAIYDIYVQYIGIYIFENIYIYIDKNSENFWMPRKNGQHRRRFCTEKWYFSVRLSPREHWRNVGSRIKYNIWYTVLMFLLISSLGFSRQNISWHAGFFLKQRWATKRLQKSFSDNQRKPL